MTDVNMTATQMQWQPKLIKLTQVGIPSIDEGQPTAVFINPQHITMICRSRVTYQVPGEEEKHQTLGTYINMVHATAHVQESPEVVAMLRDKALGFEAEGPKAVA